jgi:hypothetical protein
MFIKMQHCIFCKTGTGSVWTVSIWALLGIDKNKQLCIWYIQSDQKVSVHLMTGTKKNTQKYVKQFQSLTMIK